MGDKHSRQHFPEEDTSSSSSASGTVRGQTRYKPLAPKGPLSGELRISNLATLMLGLSFQNANWTTNTDAGHAPQLLQRSRSGAGEAARQLQDLTFVNMTDPQQSKSRESRKFVRRQVMVNFAREKRRQQKPSSPGGVQAGNSSSNTISGVQELLNAAMPAAEPMTEWSPERRASGSPGRHDVPDSLAQVPEAPTTRAKHGSQRTKAGPQPSAARLLPSAVSRASNLPGVEIPRWPVASDSHVQGLLNHCKSGPLHCSWPAWRHLNTPLHLGHSPSFRACHPQYMISLLANRPSAENYPFFIDVDSVEDLDEGYGANNAVQSEFYRLAEGSSMLAHALLMVSASHLAILEIEDAATRTRRAIDHKSKALQLLNEAIKGLPAENYMETLATIAVLASHEVGSIPKYSRLQELES
jgi:hypothetical protein